MVFLAIVFPWLALFICGKAIQGTCCLLLQLTLIGWLPAAIWAVVVVLDHNNQQRHQQLMAAQAYYAAAAGQSPPSGSYPPPAQPPRQ